MATGRDLVARFVLTLSDRLSPGLDRINGRLQRLRDIAGRIGAIGAIAAGLSFVAPVREAAAFDDTLRQMAITAGQTGDAAERSIARMGRGYERLALETRQRSQTIAEAASDLQAANLAPAVIEGMLPALARAATATGASLGDMARLAIGLNQNLGIGPAEMADTLGALAQAGKEGRFELRDMAREFPALTASLQGLGLRGRGAAESLAAMLQVVRTGTATGSEAATNLNNLLTKITSPETVRNFREAGTDLPRLIADAARRGINPVEAVIQEVRRLTQGDMFKVGELFGDTQVLAALRPFMTGSGEYLRILEQLRNANASVIDRDFETRARGAAQNMLLVEERMAQIGRAVGTAFADNLGWLNSLLAMVQSGMEGMEALMPGLLGEILTVAGGFLVLASALGVVGVAAPAIAAGFALLGGPIGLAVAAIVAAAALIYRYWDQLRPWAQSVWAGVIGVFQAAGDFLATWGRTLWTAFTATIGGIWGGLVALASGAWDGVRGVFVAFGAFVDSWTGGAMTAAVGAIQAVWQPIATFFDGLWSGIERRFNAVWEAIRPVLERVQSFFGATNEGGAAYAPEAQAERRGRMGQRGALGGFPAPEGGGAQLGGFPLPQAAPQRLQGEIVVRAAPGTEVEAARSEQPGIAMTAAPSRGPMLGTP